MPALIPVVNTVGAMFIGTVLSSIVYGVTWLQVYSYYNSHCSRDRWRLKLVDSVNMALISLATYEIGVTNFGDYQPFSLPWYAAPKELLTIMSLKAILVSAAVLELSVQHFYAYRIYLLSRGSPYLPAAIVCTRRSCLELAPTHMSMFGVKSLESLHVPGNHLRFDFIFFIATLSCNILCDVLIAFGMVYTLFRNRTHVRRTNNVLKVLAIYAINYGTLGLAFAISSITLVLIQIHCIHPPSFIMIRLHFCALMAILNSRDNLRDTLDGGVVITFTQLEVRMGTMAPPRAQVTTEASPNAAFPKSLPPFKVSSDESISENGIASDRHQDHIPEVLLV
ncbi:hypothetical protein EI94DRAFT_1732569 [Lactarius quietus]|nr:hypothetical protein EI94DRAFT_1732569 [Lactarius quietus]